MVHLLWERHAKALPGAEPHQGLGKRALDLLSSNFCPIALILLAFVAGFVLGRKGPNTEALPCVEPDLFALDAVRPILDTEGKIAAIKAYREKTGAGLRDAKLAVDALG